MVTEFDMLRKIKTCVEKFMGAVGSSRDVVEFKVQHPCRIELYSFKITAVLSKTGTKSFSHTDWYARVTPIVLTITRKSIKYVWHFRSSVLKN